jgi:hypothetical protein
LLVPDQLRQRHVRIRRRAIHVGQRLLAQSFGQRSCDLLERLLAEVSFGGQVGQVMGQMQLSRRHGQSPYVCRQLPGDTAPGVIGHLAQPAQLVHNGLLIGAPDWFGLGGQTGESRDQDNGGDSSEPECRRSSHKFSVHHAPQG